MTCPSCVPSHPLPLHTLLPLPYKTHSLEAVNHYFVVVEELMFDLSMWRCSPELKAYAAKISAKSQVG